MMNKKIVVTIEGGVVCHVYSTDPDVDVTVYDMDDFPDDHAGEQELYDATKDLPQVY